MAAPVLESFTRVDRLTGQTTTTFTKPSGTAEGDLLVLFHTAGRVGAVPNVTLPADFISELDTSVSSGSIGYDIQVAYKFAGASEPTSYSTSQLSSSVHGALFRISGADPTAPINISVVERTPNLSGSYVSPDITTTVADTLIMQFAYDVNASTLAAATAPAGYTEQSREATDRHIVETDEKATAGLEAQFSWRTGTNTGFYSSAIAIAPAAGGSTVSGDGTATGTSTVSAVGEAVGAPETEDLGEWSGTSIAQFPTTSWAAPNGIFASEARNDNSAYSFNAATSTLTLPSSGLADGYLVIGAFDSLITHNNRHNPQGRFIQASGTGNFVSAATSGYARNSTENNAYVRTWAFIDAPSAGATIQFQWKRDTGTGSPAGSTSSATLQVVPFYYSNIGMYSSADGDMQGDTSVHKVTGWSSAVQSDTAAIELATDTVTLKGDNKRYYMLGGQFFEDGATARTQRYHGFSVDGTWVDAAKGYSYIRDGNNNEIGEMFTWIEETSTADITVDQGIWRGPAVGTFPNTGADIESGTAATTAQHAWVVLELNDSAKVFRNTNSASQNANAASPTNLDIASVGDTDFNDTDTFTRASDTAMDVAAATDVLLAANVSGGYNASSTTRATITTQFTVAGAAQTSSLAGDYARGDQGTQDTWGWGSNNLSFHAVTAGQDVGIQTARQGGGPTVNVLSGYVGFLGVDIQTLKATGGGGVTSGDGAATGTSTASGQGESIRSADGTATGTSTATGEGSSTTTADGTATGTSTASGVGDSSNVQSGDGSADGTSTANAVGSTATVGAGNGTSEGTSTASGQGEATAAADGTSNGTSTASAGGLAQIVATGTATGGSTAAGSGKSTVEVTGAAEGTSTASAVGTAAGESLSNVNGTSTATGEGKSIVSATGSADGASAVIVDFSAIMRATGNASGTSTANAVGEGGTPIEEPTQQPGGWLPIKYVDRDGNEIDLDEVIEAVEDAAEEVAETAKQERRKKRILSVSKHVTNALKSNRRPDEDKLDYLRRQLVEKASVARRLAAAIEAQRRDDDEVATILLMVA